MSNKKSFAGILVIFGFILLALTGIRTISNPEIFTHIALGRVENIKTDPLSYTVANDPWVDMNPLYNKLVYKLWTFGGSELVTSVHVFVVLVAFVLLFYFAKKRGGPLSQGLALLVCARMMFPIFNPGPSVFFMLFTALFVTLLYRVKHFSILATLLLLLQVLWTNLHPSFFFGPLLIFFFTIENWQNTRNTSHGSAVTSQTPRLIGLTVAAFLVTLINPNLINLHRHILTNALLLTGTQNMEWVSLFSDSFPQKSISSLTVFVLILCAGGLITSRKRLPTMITFLVFVGAFLTVRSIGSLHLFAFLSFPFLILSFAAIGSLLSQTSKTFFKINDFRFHRLFVLITLILMILSIGGLITNRSYAQVGSASQFGLGMQKDVFPVEASKILVREDFPKTILNIAHDGGYIALTNPECRVFCDTRKSLYRADFYQTLNRALLGQSDAWRSILSEWNPHAIVLNGCWPDAGALVYRRIASRNWKLVYLDGSTIIVVRDLPEYKTLIEDSTIQQSGISILEASRRDYLRRSKGFFKAGNPSRLIGAGNIFLALNRSEEAEIVYGALVKNNPKMAGAWLGLGQSLILQKQLSKGIEYMEKAASIMPKNTHVWMRLLWAYRLKGDEENVGKAKDRLDRFYSKNETTVEQQRTPEQETSRPKQTNDFELPAQLK